MCYYEEECGFLPNTDRQTPPPPPLLRNPLAWLRYGSARSNVVIITIGDLTLPLNAGERSSHSGVAPKETVVP